MIIRKIIDNPKFSPLIQFIKFGFVGVSNTLISYGIEMLCFYVLFANTSFESVLNFLKSFNIFIKPETICITFTTAIAFIVSVTNSYILNNRFVFFNGEKKFSQHLLSYFKTICCYGVTGLVLSPIIKIFLKNNGVPYYLAAVVSLAFTIPLNFVLNKFWAFKNEPRR